MGKLLAKTLFSVYEDNRDLYLYASDLEWALHVTDLLEVAVEKHFRHRFEAGVETSGSMWSSGSSYVMLDCSKASVYLVYLAMFHVSALVF